MHHVLFLLLLITLYGIPIHVKMICALPKAFIFNRIPKNNVKQTLHNVKQTLHFVGGVKHTLHPRLRDVTYL